MFHRHAQGTDPTQRSEQYATRSGTSSCRFGAKRRYIFDVVKKVGTVHDQAAQRRERPEFVHPRVLVCTRFSNLGPNSTVTSRPSKFSLCRRNIENLGPKFECDRRVIRTRPDAFPYEAAHPEAMPHSQTMRRPPQRAGFGRAMTPTRAERRLTRPSPSAVERTPFASIWYMTATYVV